MKIDYSKIDDVTGEITIAIEENDYADNVKKELKEVAKHRPEPGFRPGKTPMGLIEKKYGAAVKYDVINKLIGDKLFEYIRDNKLHVLGNPVPEPNNEITPDAKEMTFKFKVGIAPEIDTHVNKELHVPYYKIQITDEMIDNQDKNLCQRFGKQVPGEEVDANALVKGVITELNEDGTPKEGGIVVENGILGPRYFKDEAQKELFIGKKVGDKVVFNPYKGADGNEAELSSMLNIQKEDVENHKGDFDFDIKEIIVLKPAEHDQEFFDAVLGKDKVHNDEEYRAALKEVMETGLANDADYRFSIDAKNDILKAVGEIKLPEEIVKNFLVSQNENLTAENIDTEYPSIVPQLTWELVSEAIAEQLGVKLEENDIMEMARAIAQQQFAQYGMTSVPAESIDQLAREILKDQKYRSQLTQQTFERKLFNAIKDAVTLDEKEVSVEDFNKLFTANN